MLRDVFRSVRRAKHQKLTFLRVWLIPESHRALKTIEQLEGVTTADAVNRALQGYARSVMSRPTSGRASVRR